LCTAGYNSNKFCNVSSSRFSGKSGDTVPIQIQQLDYPKVHLYPICADLRPNGLEGIEATWCFTLLVFL